MSSVQLVDPLTDGEPHPRMSFSKFAKRLAGYVEKFGRERLILTYAAALGDPDEAIDSEELAKPRTGFYRARIDGMPQRIEAHYTHALDIAPRDPRQSIDSQYQALNETMTVRLGMASQELIEMQARLKTERDLRFAAEDENRIFKRRVEELEAELEAIEQPIFDESMIDCARVLFGDLIEMNDTMEAATEALTAIENNVPVGLFLQEHCPNVILLLAKVAGEPLDNSEAP